MTTTILSRHREEKSLRPDHLHLFRVGDCYDAFHDDAEIISTTCNEILSLHRTGIPMVVISSKEIRDVAKQLAEAGHLVKLHDDGAGSVSPVSAGLFDEIGD